MAQPWQKYQLSQDQYDHVFAIFLTFDTDGSGELDRRELTTLARYMNYPHTRSDIDRMFREMDTDGSGQLDMDEFCTWMCRNRPDPMALYGMTHHQYDGILFTFHKFDRDQNGALDTNEFHQLCTEEKWTQSRPQSDALFGVIDTNGDRTLDLNEILAYRRQNPQAFQQGGHGHHHHHQHHQHQRPTAPPGQTMPQYPSYGPPPPTTGGYNYGQQPQPGGYGQPGGYPQQPPQQAYNQPQYNPPPQHPPQYPPQHAPAPQYSAPQSRPTAPATNSAPGDLRPESSQPYQDPSSGDWRV